MIAQERSLQADTALGVGMLFDMIGDATELALRIAGGLSMTRQLTLERGCSFQTL